MKTILTLLLLIILATGAYYLLKKEKPNVISDARESVTEGASSIKREVTNAISQLRTSDIVEEMKKDGRVVRKKAENLGSKMADSAADARITATLKGQFALDKELSAIGISVNTTAGMVTLSGQVDSADAIKKAMEMALHVEGVREVVSTLQIRQAAAK